MMLPSNLKNKSEWVFVGPMGPELSNEFENYPLICVDGGANFTKKMDIWVGDADSYDGAARTEFHFKFSQDKDQSDLALALNLFKERQNYTFHFWGFLGGRRDHELFNIGEALNFLEDKGQSTIIFYGQDGKVYYELLSTGKWKFNHVGLFSVGVIKKTQLKLFGHCLYSISAENPLNPLSSLGLSNKGFGEITLETIDPIFLYYPEGK